MQTNKQILKEVKEQKVIAWQSACNYWTKTVANQVMGNWQTNQKKIKRDKLEKELRNAFMYGVHNATLSVLNSFNVNPTNDVMEVIADLQTMTCEAYEDLRIKGNLKIPVFNLDKLLEGATEIEV